MFAIIVQWFFKWVSVYHWKNTMKMTNYYVLNNPLRKDILVMAYSQRELF